MKIKPLIGRRIRIGRRLHVNQPLERWTTDHGVPGSNSTFSHPSFPLLKNSKSGVDDRGHRLRITHTLRRPCFKALWSDPLRLLLIQKICTLTFLQKRCSYKFVETFLVSLRKLVYLPHLGN